MVEISADERALRVQLAAAYRLADRYGMSEIVNTHISLRVPGQPPTFLINPQGLLFEEICASNLVRVDLQGNVVGPSAYPPHRVGAAIHSAVYAVRPEVNCVFHTHTPYATAVSSLECGLLPMSQAALRFAGRIAYHDYGRAGDDPLERGRLQEDLGERWAMLLRNHGALTLGKTVGQAFIAAFYLEKACQFQVLAQSTGQPLTLPRIETPAGPRRAPRAGRDRLAGLVAVAGPHRPLLQGLGRGREAW